MEKIGEKIKKRREELGLSQETLAKRLGYSTRSAITRIEKGERELPLDKLKDLCVALSVNPMYFVEWDSAVDFINKLDFNDEELQEILQFINFVRSKRK